MTTFSLGIVLFLVFLYVLICYWIWAILCEDWDKLFLRLQTGSLFLLQAPQGRRYRIWSFVLLGLPSVRSNLSSVLLCWGGIQSARVFWVLFSWWWLHPQPLCHCDFSVPSVGAQCMHTLGCFLPWWAGLWLEHGPCCFYEPSVFNRHHGPEPQMKAFWWLCIIWSKVILIISVFALIYSWQINPKPTWNSYSTVLQTWKERIKGDWDGLWKEKLKEKLALRLGQFSMHFFKRHELYRKQKLYSTGDRRASARVPLLTSVLSKTGNTQVVQHRCPHEQLWSD